MANAHALENTKPNIILFSIDDLNDWTGGLGGHSLVPLMQNPQADWPHVALSSFGKGNYAVRSEHFRYIRYLDGSEEFYDHREDPHEWHNLAGREDLTKLIETHRQRLPTQDADVLPGNSTGHQAYKAASRFVSE